MPYGQIKVDEITFTNAGVDQTISVSGVVASISGNITATGTISGDVIRGGTLVSGATVTGTAGQFGTITGNTAGFTTVTGTTVTGTTAQFTTVTGGTAGFTTITGTTVTGTTANFVTVSGTTVTGNVGNFTTVTGGTVTLTSGVFGAGTASLPSISFTSDPNTGIYSPGADQVAVATSGTGRLFVDASGNVGLGTSTTTLGGNAFRMAILGTKTYSELIPRDGLAVADNTATAQGVGGSITLHGIYDGSGNYTAFAGIEGQKENGTSGNYAGALVLKSRTNFGFLNEALRIDSLQRVGIGTTSPGALLHLQSSTSGQPELRIEGAGADNGLIAWRGGGHTNNSVGIRYISTGAGTGNLAFYANGTDSATLTERARIDSSGRLLVGTSTARANFFNSTASAALQVEGSGDAGRISVLRSDANGTLILGYTPSASNGNSIGSLSYQAYDGSEFVEAASVRCEIDGTPGANDMPGRLVFSTTADGASSPTERMRITSAGLVGIGTASPGVALDVTGAIRASTTVTDVAGNVRAIPQNSQSGSYTLVASDLGKHISISSGGVTVPVGVFSTGDVVSIYNNSGSNQTISQGSSTLRQAGTANTGNRTLAQYGIATILCVASNTFVISGAGLT